MTRRGEQLVAAARFESRDDAETGWQLLIDAGIPASVVTDPGTLGEPVVSMLMVARDELRRAQALVADLIAK